MSDATTERKMWNGRQFDVEFRETSNGMSSRWVAWISVVGKEQISDRNRASFTGLSRPDVEEQAEQWMRKWRN